MKHVKRILLPILTLLTLYTFHDMERAQGIGFYFYLKTGVLNRTGWEVIIDALIALFIAAVLWVWVKSAGNTAIESLFDALITYLVFVPLVPLNYFHAVIFSRSDLPANPDVTAFAKRDLLNLGLTITVFIVLKIVTNTVKSANGADSTIEDFRHKNTQKHVAISDTATNLILICLGILAAVISILIPQIQKLLFYILHLVIAFLIFKVTQREKFNSNIYTGFLIITAVFKLIQTTAMY